MLIKSAMDQFQQFLFCTAPESPAVMNSGDAVQLLAYGKQMTPD